ncbi:MAG: GreA/GreB family elongation factor [Planctomycetota bacterium]
MSNFREAVDRALREERWDDYEEIWLDALENESGSMDEYLRAARIAAEANQGHRVSSVLALLAPQIDALRVEKRQTFYETLVMCSPKNRDYRDRLLDVYREQYGSAPGFDTYVKTADLQRTDDPATAIQSFYNMVKYMTGSFVYHRSGWGVGQITDVDGIAGVAVVDFKDKPGHRVQIDALPDICEQLPEDHFLIMQWKQPEALEDLRDNKPAELVKKVLRTSSKPMALPRIRQTLIGAVVPTGSWSKWWTKARNQLKKDSEVGTTSSRTPEYFLLEGPEGIAASLDRRLANQGLKQQLRILREAIEDAETDDEKDAVRPYLDKLPAAVSISDGPPELKLEALLFMKHREIDYSSMPPVQEILDRSEHPGDVINLLPRQEDQREVIDMLRETHADAWERMHTDFLLRSDDAPRRYLVELMCNEAREEEIDECAKQTVRVPKNAPLYFLWLVKKVGLSNYDLIPSLEGTRGIDLYLKGLSLLNDFNVQNSEKSSPVLDLTIKRYKQQLAGRPYKVLISVLKDAEISAVRAVYKEIEASTAFSSASKQGLLAAILREQPTVLARGAAEKQQDVAVDDSVIYSTDVGIARKRKELEEIRNDKLPAIFKLIGEAAEFGDLSENAEFTSAIEERENLNRRAMEIQSQLDKVRRIDPKDASTEFVTLGSRVTLTNTINQERNTFSLLGPWDGGPEDGVLSYMSPLGRALVDKKPGEEFSVTLPTGEANFRVEAIQLHGGPDLPAASASSASEHS